MTSHIPNKGQKYINYYGYYSNKSRGLRAKTESQKTLDIVGPATASQKSYKKTWAMLIKKVWEIDPLVCPKCKSQMKVVEICINKFVINKILKEMSINIIGLERGPPNEKKKLQEIELIPIESDWGDHWDD